MKLEDLLNAAAQLEKRIETDRMLRACFSALWNDTDRKAPRAKAVETSSASTQSITLNFPTEFWNLVKKAAQTSGKSPGQLLEESFAEYYLKHFAK